MTGLGLFALAFTSGLVSPINPCGFALLPAYLAYHLGTDQDRYTSTAVRLGRGLRTGTALALGFAGTLSLAGLAIALGARSLLLAAPWLSLGVGIVLTVVGLVMLAGRSLSLRLPNAVRRPGIAPTTTPRMVAFGMGYAITSLTCTFGVLLAVITQAMAAGSILTLLGVFTTYAVGAATLLLLVSLAAAVASTALERVTRLMARAGGRLAGAVLVLTGIYLITYWWPAANGTSTNSGIARTVANAGAHTQMWVQAHQELVVLIAGISVIAALTAVVRTRRRTSPTASDEHNCCSETRVR